MDNINILSWNVRGLNARARRDDARLVVEECRASLVCVQETKLAVVTDLTILEMLGTQFLDYAFLPASDTRGGILVAARRSAVTITDVHLGCFSITVKVQCTATADVWWLTVVYGPQLDPEKALFMEELIAVRAACTGPWVVVGDFNLILDEADKNNARINRRNLRLFRQTVDQLELQDIHLNGRKYTWSNERHQPTLVKLDRVLVSLDWEERFPSCFLQALSSDASDHCPLLLQTNAAFSIKPRFHFEVYWPKCEGFLEAVARGWQCPSTITDPFRRLDQFLRNTARELQSWSAKYIGHIKSQLLIAREIILRLDQQQERRQLTEVEIELRKDMKHQCLGLASLERTIARQRSRIRELKEGDANTRYFHLKARGRRRKNYVVSVRNSHTSAFTQEEKAQVFYDHFVDVLGFEEDRSSTINLAALGVPALEMHDLTRPFTEQEVWEVIKEMPADRAPGPDGFTGAFYKAAWPVIKGDVMWAVHSFASAPRLSFRCLNNAFIILLPKTPEPKEAKDYRPITLVHSFAKLLSKLLANRLTPYLSELVGSNQSAFIKRRSILDN